MSDVTADELMAITASRLLDDHKVVFAGVGMPLLASAVARRTHAPHLTIVLEGGIIGTVLLPGKLPISTNEMRAAYGAQMLTGITDIFLYAQRGYFDYGFLGADVAHRATSSLASAASAANRDGPAATRNPAKSGYASTFSATYRRPAAGPCSRTAPA